MFYVLIGAFNAKHPSSFYMNRPKGINNYLFLIIKCRAKITIAEETFVVEPNSALLIKPNTPYSYRSLSGEYINDWFHFDCTNELILEKSHLPFHRPIPLSNSIPFSFYLQQILWKKDNKNDQYRKNDIHMLLQVLFHNLILADQEKEHATQYSPYYNKLQTIRALIQSHPNEKISAEKIAKKLNISVSYLQHLYTIFFGTSLQKDIIHMRIEYAKNLIITSNLKLNKIAELCGYSSDVYFYRQFKSKTGMTPKEYLHKHINS